MTKAGTLALSLLMASTAGAFAHRSAVRSAEQAYQIEEGRKDGSITWTEGIKLRKEQREISRLKNTFTADGKLTAAEKRILRKKQNVAKSHIGDEGSDRLRRLWWLPRVGK